MPSPVAFAPSPLRTPCCSEKYRVTSEEVADALAGLCAARPVALRALFVQLVWAWVSGNGDLHAKNVSIRGDGSGEWRIAPAYDIPSTLPDGDVHGMALPLGGRNDGLSRRTFLRFARDLGLPEPVAQRAIEDALRVGGDLLAAAEAGRFTLPPGAAPRKLARQLRARRTSMQA